MIRKLLIAFCLLCSLSVKAQYKNDNVLYKTVDPAELCSTLDNNKGYILLDVRSKAEHDDTSSSLKYNLGHLKDAKNIDVGELGTRLSEIQAYKDQPVFVYCSHSQRSRRASKMLADSGFTRVFNINGGMTAIYYTGAYENECLRSLVETNNNYDLISATELCDRMKVKDNNVFVLDVRSDSAFRHISNDPKSNAYGAIRNAVNIPLADLPSKLSTLPKASDIIVADMYGDDAARAAILLNQNGFGKVTVLIEGMDRLVSSTDPGCKKEIYSSPVSYQLLNATAFGGFAGTHSDYVLLDVRTTDEFSNKHKDYWRNIGHLKNAVNIPSADIKSRLPELVNYKDKEIVIYSFGSSPDIFATADALQKEGFKKVNVLLGGVFNLRWTAANVKGQAGLKDLVVEVPEVNR